MAVAEIAAERSALVFAASNGKLLNLLWKYSNVSGKWPMIIITERLRGARAPTNQPWRRSDVIDDFWEKSAAHTHCFFFGLVFGFSGVRSSSRSVFWHAILIAWILQTLLLCAPTISRRIFLVICILFARIESNQPRKVSPVPPNRWKLRSLPVQLTRNHLADGALSVYFASVSNFSIFLWLFSSMSHIHMCAICSILYAMHACMCTSCELRADETTQIIIIMTDDERNSKWRLANATQQENNSFSSHIRTERRTHPPLKCNKLPEWRSGAKCVAPVWPSRSTD